MNSWIEGLLDVEDLRGAVQRTASGCWQIQTQ